MAEIDVLKAQIVRENVSVPWGFRLQGGTDYGQPLTILRVGLLTTVGDCNTRWYTA